MPNETPFTMPALSAAQRRVLGTLIEKGLTTPEYYPLTLKALTTGCNQKNNRDPITTYTETDVEEVMDQLRELGVAVVVHTETGRSERFRHLLRHKLTITEPQIAIFGELLLRGRQAIGELRSRASRMVVIDSLEQLRTELDGLIRLKFVQANDDLDRRGVEVDHALYQPREGQTMSRQPPSEVDHAGTGSSSRPVSEVTRPAFSGMGSAVGPAASTGAGGVSAAKWEALETAVAELRQQNAELRSQMDDMRGELDDVSRQLEDLRRALGG